MTHQPKNIILAALTALFVLSGCTGIPSVPTHPVAQSLTQSEMTAGPASAIAFTSIGSGSFTVSNCYGAQGRAVFLSGLGRGTLFHLHSESGTLSADQCNPGGEASWAGLIHFVVEAHPQNSISMSLKFDGTGPCDPVFGPKILFTVSGGTGRFAHAVGSGRVYFRCVGGGRYTDVWSGQITI